MKHIIIPIAAALAGAGVGFYIGNRVGDTKGREAVWEVANAEIENTEDRIKRRYKVAEYSEPKEYFDDDNKRVNSLPEELTQIEPEKLKSLVEHINNGGYHDISSDASGHGNIFDNFRNQDVVEEIIEVVPDSGNPNRHDPEPIIISELEYSQDEEDHDKLSVSWYPGDRTLVDSAEQVIDDVEGTVGLNNLNHLGAEDFVLYVRNYRLGHDYEIAVALGSYRDTVLGEDESVMERPRARPRKPRAPRDE